MLRSRNATKCRYTSSDAPYASLSMGSLLQVYNIDFVGKCQLAASIQHPDLALPGQAGQILALSEQIVNRRKKLFTPLQGSPPTPPSTPAASPAGHHACKLPPSDCRSNAPAPSRRLRGSRPLSLHTETAPRVAQRRHEQMQPHVLAADRHPRLAEVDLRLVAGRRTSYPTSARRPQIADSLGDDRVAATVAPLADFPQQPPATGPRIGGDALA